MSSHIFLMVMEALEYEEAETIIEHLNEIVESLEIVQTLDEELVESKESESEVLLDSHFEVGGPSGIKDKGKGIFQSEESDESESVELVDTHFEVGESSGVKESVENDEVKGPKEIFTSSTDESSSHADDADGEEEEQEHINPYPQYSSISLLQRRHPFATLRALSVLGGIIMGYAASFLGGVLSMPVFFRKMSPTLYNRQRFAENTPYCTFSDIGFLILLSIVPLSAFISLLTVFWFSTRWGRRVVLLGGVFSQLIGIGLVIWFPTISIVVLGLILIGFGVGIYVQVIPAICSESIPPHLHRQFGTLFGYQVLGSTLASVANFGASYFFVWGWRIPFGVLGSLVVLLAVLSSFVRETPAYYMEQDLREEALKALRRMRPNSSVVDIEAEWGELVQATEENKGKNRLRELLHRPNLPALAIMTSAVLLPQMVATVPLLFFGPLISVSLSSINREVFVTTLAAGILGLLATVLTSWFLPIIRRRKLLIGSSIAILVSQISLWILFVFVPVGDADADLDRTQGYLAAAMMVVNYVGVAVLINPHGWINSQISGAGGRW